MFLVHNEGMMDAFDVMPAIIRKHLRHHQTVEDVFDGKSKIIGIDSAGLTTPGTVDMDRL